MVHNPVFSVFYQLPKLCKNCTPIQGRPLVADIGSLFEKLGHWVYGYLQLLVLRLPGYIKDTTALLTNIEQNNWSDSSNWITLDVKSLYSSIPHELALEALKFHLHHYSLYCEELKEFIVLTVHFLLKHNFFIFDKVFYLQIWGASMRAKFSPSLSNLYMGWWEEKYLFSSLNLFMDCIRWYGRFIDDLLLIWECSPDNIASFVVCQWRFFKSWF